jgi:hypothetical protein
MSDDDSVDDRKSPSKPAIRFGLKKRVRIIIRRVPFKPILRKKPQGKMDRTKPILFSDGVRKPPIPTLDPGKIRIPKPDRGKIRSLPLLETTRPNIIDLKNHRVEVEERQATTPVAPKAKAPVVTCSVARPGQRHWEGFDFVAVPAVGVSLTLGYEPEMYVVASVMHAAAEAGSGQPFVYIRTRAKKQKR